jgi:hypothetical protein
MPQTKPHPVLRNIVLVLSVLLGCAIGGFGMWVFHFIIEADAQFLTNHRTLSAVVGIFGMLMFANIIWESKKRSPRGYGLLVLGIAVGIFLQSIIYFPGHCDAACSTDFTLKLGACLILMVDGFASFHSGSVKPTNDTKAQVT